jgi:predicted transcriptional regulator
MLNWKDQLAEAEEKLRNNDLRTAFLAAFGALEICFCGVAQKVGIQGAKTNDDLLSDTLRALRDRRKITEDEFSLARHLAQGRNVVAHKYGFEPSAAEIQKTINRVKRLCSRFGAKVSDIMITPVIQAAPNDIVGSFIRHFVDDGISLIPVVDNDKVVGTLSDKAVISAWESAEGILDLKTPVCELMSAYVLPDIRPDASVAEARKMLIRNGGEALLVLHKGVPTGIITKFDLLDHLESLP